MEDHLTNLDELNLSQEELFAPVDNNTLDSEKITAPRYSYWHSVFRVFFRKKINIVILLLLAAVIVFSYVYPAIIHYDAAVDPYINLMDSEAKHLGPTDAMNKFGQSIRWILGSGESGESTFDAVWYGASISLSLALICALINLTVGIIIGAIWGFSKKVDIFMTEVYNIIGNVPYILLISVVVLILSPSPSETEYFCREHVSYTDSSLSFRLPFSLFEGQMESMALSIMYASSSVKQTS